MNQSKQVKAIILALFLVIEHLGQCCINEYRVLLSGELVFTSAGNVVPRGRFANDKQYLLKKLYEADSIYKLTGRLEDYSDFASMLVYNGQYLQAKQIFQSIEQKSPGLYQTVANLGTTYELLGKNDSALYWIKKAIEINPNSHDGSEWIHVKILQAKIKANGDESYLLKNDILSLGFGDGEIPENKNGINLIELRNQLNDQLRERISFVKPEDPVVAQLLFDLGNIYAMTKDIKSSLQIFQLAQDYGNASPLFNKRLAYFEKLQFKADFVNITENWIKDHPLFVLIVFGVAFITFIIMSMLLLKQIRKRQKKQTRRGNKNKLPTS